MKMNLMISILAVAFIGFGCSKKTSVHDDPSLPIGPDVVDPDDVYPDSGNGYGTNSVTLNTSYSEMNSYVGIRPLNDPQNIKLTVNLVKDSRSRYTGSVKISYNDNGVYHEGVFSANNSKNMTIKYAEGNNMYENEYNYWWTDHGSTVFNGIFQDAYGGIVLVIDRAQNSGNNDGVGTTTLSGSVWYRNFATVSYPQSSHRRCWFIKEGAYDCRSSSVINKSSIFPADTYRKLGTFSGLAKSKAFLSN